MEFGKPRATGPVGRDENQYHLFHEEFLDDPGEKREGRESIEEPGGLAAVKNIHCLRSWFWKSGIEAICLPIGMCRKEVHCWSPKASRNPLE